MNIGTIKGKNYEYGGGVIDFFGYKAVCSNGVWSANWIYREGFYPIKRDPSILTVIAECIAIDVKAGNGDRIKQLQINPKGAIGLFMLNTIKVDDLMRAQEPDDGSYIDIPNVQISGRKLTVRVSEKFKFASAIADADGVII